MSELKPCPFCEGKARFERIGNARRSTVVVCEDCGCRHESGFVGHMAYAGWNNRPHENKLKADAVRDSIGSVSCKGDTQYDVLRQLEEYADKLEKGEL